MSPINYELDPMTKKLLPHHGEDSIFTVYTKRYNSRRIPVHIASGLKLKDALSFFYDLDVFEHDRKYLYHRLATETRDQEQKVLAINGKGRSMVLADSVRPGRKKINFNFRDMASVKHIPVTIINGLKTFVRKSYTVNGLQMSKTRLISILLAEFVDLPEQAKLEFLARGDLALERHKLDSGGVSVERLQKALVHAEKYAGEDEADLL